MRQHEGIGLPDGRKVTVQVSTVRWSIVRDLFMFVGQSDETGWAMATIIGVTDRSAPEHQVVGFAWTDSTEAAHQWFLNWQDERRQSIH